jgi:hypothetical protein
MEASSEMEAGPNWLTPVSCERATEGYKGSQNIPEPQPHEFNPESLPVRRSAARPYRRDLLASDLN